MHDSDLAPPPGRKYRRHAPGACAALLAAALVAACTDHVVDPAPAAGPSPAAPPARAFVPPVADAPMSAASLYVPASNAVRWGAVPWTELPADFGDAGWVELRTTGQVSWTINTATYAVNSWYCNGSNAWPYYGEGSVGGAGDASSNLRMTAVVSSAAPADDDYGALMVARGGGQVYRLSAAWPGARLYAKRSGLPGVCNGSPWYNFTGEHTVEVVKVTPVQVEPNKPEFLPGEVLTWTTHLYDGVTKLVWTFEGTNGEVGYPACSTSTCEYAPPGPGRMKVRGVWELAAPTVHVHDYSPLVTVQPPRLVLNCPASVQRGSNMTCSAMGQGGALSDVRWMFTPPDSMGPPVPGPNDSTSWGGTMVVGGIMRVTGKVGAIVDTAYATISINPRDWVGRLDYPAEPPPEITATELPYPPVTTTSGPLKDGVFGGARLSAPRGVYGDGTGPNAGWLYLGSPPVFSPPPRIFINAGLNPGDPFYEAQTGGAGYCDKAFMDSARAHATAHERKHFQIDETYFESADAARLAEGGVVYDSGGQLTQLELDARVFRHLLAEVSARQSALDSSDVLYIRCTFRTIS